MREVLAVTLARHVLRQYAGEHAEPAALAEAAERADARLRGRLAGLIGLTGYTILVARAVRLAQAEVPTLDGITVAVGTGGGLQGIRDFVALAQANGGAEAAEAGLIAILAHTIALLSTFIGEDLALRLVQDAWPELANSPVESEG